MWSKSTFIHNKRKFTLFSRFHKILEIWWKNSFLGAFCVWIIKICKREKFMRRIPLLFNDYLKNSKLSYDSEDVKLELKKRLDYIWTLITPKILDIQDFQWSRSFFRLYLYIIIKVIWKLSKLLLLLFKMFGRPKLRWFLYTWKGNFLESESFQKAADYFHLWMLLDSREDAPKPINQIAVHLPLQNCKNYRFRLQPQGRGRIWKIQFTLPNSIRV